MSFYNVVVSNIFPERKWRQKRWKWVLAGILVRSQPPGRVVKSVMC